MSAPRIIPTVYTARGVYGDFLYMIEDPQYRDSLFIFNDNAVDHPTARLGRGNALIRPYNRFGSHSDYPHSAGIPTGYSRSSGGYSAMTLSAQEAIDSAIDEIKDLIYTHDYRRIYFSAQPSPNRPKLATSIFHIGEDVRNYITNAIYALGEKK